MPKPDSQPCAAWSSARLRRVFVCLLLGAAGVAVYWTVAGYDFISIDDHLYFGENEHVLAGLTWRNLAWAFQTTLDASWYPLSWLSFMLDAELFGRGPAGPHWMNVLLHVANGILLFLLLGRLTGSFWRSAFVAGLFAVHPLHVESVAWVSERKDVLSTFFGLLALVFYARYAEVQSLKSKVQSQDSAASNTQPATRNTPHTIRYYVLSLFFFALGLLSKPMLVTLPFVMLLLDYWPLGRVPASGFARQPSTTTRLLWEKVPFLTLALIASAVTVAVHKHAGVIAPLATVSTSARVANALVSYARYLGQTFWPTGLAMPYLHPGHWPPGAAGLGAALVAGVSAIALWQGRRRPYLLVGWCWFLGTLVPVIGLIQWGSQSMADRFMYVPSVGLFIAVAWGLGELLARWHWPKPAVGSAAVLVLLALALRSRDQLGYWRDSAALFQHTIQVTTGNYVAYDGLGSALERQGKHIEALPYMSESVRLQPRYLEGQYDLGTLLLKMGRLEEALQHLTAAVQLNPAFAHAHINLGKALLDQGKLDEAAAHLSRAVQLTPDDPEAHYNLGTLLLLQAKPDQAIACFSEALRLKPDYGEAHGNLGVALMRQGKLGEGATHLTAALRLNPNNPEAHYNLGLALLELNRPREAADQFSEALRLNPDALGPHYHLALALVRQNQPKEALPHAQKARDLALAAGQPTLAAKADELLKQLRSP
jgi:tetratricopeptide (TPR) repeat protein